MPALKETRLRKHILNTRSARLTALFFTLLALGSCSLGYYQQAAFGHLNIIQKQQSIEQLLSPSESSVLSDKEIKKLRLVQQVRDLAESTLALPVDNTYSSYVDIGKPYVVWNVFAASEFSVEPHQWCYPVIGCASYRGYYKEANAQKYARKMQAKGLETFVGGVRAYSTLGWFDDPVLNTFITQDDLQIVSLLIHEISHRIAYAKNDTAFNESFATAIELFGVEVWLKQNSMQIDDNERNRYYRRREMQEDFIQIVLKTRTELEVLYKSSLDTRTMREKKQLIFDELKGDLALLDQEYRLESYYERWANTVNNAKIAPVNSYNQWVSAIRKKLDSSLADAGCSLTSLSENSPDQIICHESLKLFYQRIKELAKLPNTKRQIVLERWGAI